MKYREFGSTGWKVSEIGLGTWQLMDSWDWGSEINVGNAENIIKTAIKSGINFFDTADVYSDGKSEKFTAEFIKKYKSKSDIYIATKCGMKLNPHTIEEYNKKNIDTFVQNSIANMKVHSLDLIQLHCPPTAVYSKKEVFQVLEDLQSKRTVKFYGVSVEKVDEALKALEYENVVSIQIIFNMFRIKPAEQLFEKAKELNKAIIARVPLASGLLTGKFTKESKFSEYDHRNFNREGKSFDKGETFSGIDYNKGLNAVKELQEVLPNRFTLAQYALKWILMHDAVSTVIPGASKPEQVIANAKASDIPDFSSDVMDQVTNIYNKYFRKDIHNMW